jgi:hypothetical protein
MGNHPGQRNADADGAPPLSFRLHDQRAGAAGPRHRTPLPLQGALSADDKRPDRSGLSTRVRNDLRSAVRLFHCSQEGALEEKSASGSLGSAMDRKNKPRRKSIDSKNDRIGADVQSEKRVDVTADLPFDFVVTPDPTKVLWERLGLPPPEFDFDLDLNIENMLLDSQSDSQNRLLRGLRAVIKGQLLQRRTFGNDFKEFCGDGKVFDMIHRTVQELPFESTSERAFEFAKVVLWSLFKFKSSQQILGETDERRTFDEFLTAAELLSRNLKSIESHPILSSRFDIEIGGAVREALRQAGIEVRFNAVESKAKILKTLLYRGSAVEIIDLILFIIRKSIIKADLTLAAARKIRDASANKFVYEIALYWYLYTSNTPTLSRADESSETKVPRQALFEPFVEAIAPGIGKSTIRTSVELFKAMLNAQAGITSA